MTSFLFIAVLLIGALFMLNLLLTVGVIRRLKEHTELIQNISGTGQAEQGALQVGETAGAFVTTTEEGTEVNREDLTEETLVAFLSPDCPACAEQLPFFLEVARDFPGGRENVLAVIVGPREEAVAEVERIAPVARISLEEDGGSVATALRVRAFPSFLRLDANGRVLAGGYLAADMEAPVAA